MKRAIFFSILILAFFCLSAQKFMRYQMKDGSFIGFYTSSCPLIGHTIETQETTISTDDVAYNLSLDNIERIIIEDIHVSRNFAGDYRIYEQTDPQGDLKKVIVDNRGCLLASKNGDFGANDTILFASEYNDERALFFTDSIGQVRKYFTGESLYTYLYSDHGLENVIEFTSLGCIYDHPISNQPNKTRSIKALAPTCEITVNDFLTSARENQFNVLSTLKDLAQNYTELGDDPELHNQFLILDGIILANDFAGLAASTGKAVFSGGWSWVEFMGDLRSFHDSLEDLLNDMFPDSKQRELYLRYYQEHYGINLNTLKPTDITSTTATLNGSITSDNGINGQLSFYLKKMLSDDDERLIIPTIQNAGSQTATLSASANDLQPSTRYFYYLNYDFVVDGLTLNIASPPMDFRTLTPQAETLGVEDVTSSTAKVKCAFYNVPEGAVCGIQYSLNGSSDVVRGTSAEGAQYITLTGLLPQARYNYRAFIQYNGENFYGETREFTTQYPNKMSCEVLNYNFSINALSRYISADYSMNHEFEPSLSTDLKFNIALERKANITYVANYNGNEYPLTLNEDSFIIHALDWDMKSKELTYDYNAEKNEVSIFLDKKETISICKIDETGNRSLVFVIRPNTSFNTYSTYSTSDIIIYDVPIILNVIPTRNISNVTLSTNDTNHSLIMEATKTIHGLLAFYVCSDCIPGWSWLMGEVKMDDLGLYSSYVFYDNYNYTFHREYKSLSISFNNAERTGVAGYDNNGDPIYIWRRYGEIEDDLLLWDKKKKFFFPHQSWHIEIHQDWLCKKNGSNYYSPGEIVVDSFEIIENDGYRYD